MWLDDKRAMPPGFDVHVLRADHAIELLRGGLVTAISLDHDLGDEALCGTGYDVAKEIEALAHAGTLRRIIVHLHTQNPVGLANMKAAIMSAERFWQRH